MTDVPSHIAESLKLAHSRIDRHEGRLQTLERNEAGMTEWRANTTEKLDSIRSGIRWIATLIIAGLLGAVINFIIAGGLNGAQ
jgi:hypothetical protein